MLSQANGGRVCLRREPHPHGGRRGAGPQPEPVGDVGALALVLRMMSGHGDLFAHERTLLCAASSSSLCCCIFGLCMSEMVRGGIAYWQSHSFPMPKLAAMLGCCMPAQPR